MSCSNEAKKRKPLKLAGVPQSNETILAASRLKFTILWEHVEEILLLNKFSSDCREFRRDDMNGPLLYSMLPLH